MTAEGWILLYILIINMAAFYIYGLDKWKASKQKWRIPEKALFGIAIAGGSFGARLGMAVFRHKTRHRSFVIGIPLIFLIQCILIFGYYYFAGATAFIN